MATQKSFSCLHTLNTAVEEGTNLEVSLANGPLLCRISLYDSVVWKCLKKCAG